MFTPQAGGVTRIQYGEPHTVPEYPVVDFTESFSFQYTVL